MSHRLRILIPPTCVGLQYGRNASPHAAFLGSIGSLTSFTLGESLLASRPLCDAFNPTPQPTSFNHHVLRMAQLPFSVPACFNNTSRYRNINLLSITYAFRPQLRVRLTLGRLPLPRKPWVFGVQGFHLHYRYLWQHKLFLIIHYSFRYSFNSLGTLLYRSM